ncbi:MAG: hypothetical protein IKM26_03715 [Clostridia bacterium]|nr:hypothetical protein [Clostridia bacterium]MBR6787015.1 hypothetical protein [Clostridia bacterium]
MKIDLTCPVELWHHALPTPEDPVCRLQLFNLTEQTVVSIQAVFSCYDRSGALMSRQVERVQGLLGEPRSAFEMTTELEDGLSVDGLDFSIEKVWFSDGTVWRHVMGHGSEYTPNALPSGRRLDVLLYLAGADAMGFPSDQGAVWVCVCGRPNSPGEDSCRRCGRQKRDVFTSFNEASVETIIFNHESAMEEKARRERAEKQRIAEAQAALLQKKKKRRRAITVSVTLTVLLLLSAWGIYFHGIPYYRYYTAREQMENGVYVSARSEFVKLAALRGKYSLPIKVDALNLDIDLLDSVFYHKSATLIKECDYRQAKSSMQTGTITSLKTAQDAFDALGEYQDSADLAKAARYQRAEHLAATGQYESAVAVYDEILTYESSADRRSAAVYNWAGQLMSQKDYTAAREKYLSLGNYQDAATQANDCLYQPALSAIDSGDYLSAISLLSQLDAAYQNTALRLQEAYYGAAGQYFDQQDYDTAADYYLLAGDYLDAYSQATACLYEPAYALMQDGDYAAAKESFDKILTYRDSQQLSYECSYMLALAEYELGNYAQACLLVEDALEYAPAAELMQECTYLPAVALQQEDDLTNALMLFESIPGYRDADDRAQLIRYDLALIMMENKNYAAAITAFEALGAYENSAAELQKAQYAYALQLIDNAQYEDASARLTALSPYEESDFYYKKAQFLLGQQYDALGDLSSAAACYYNAGDYEGAAAQYGKCMYTLAEAALAKEDFDAAAGYLSMIPDYADAEVLRQQSVYRSAALRRDAGDLSGAAAQFASIPDYEDAAAQAEACYDAYYAEAYTAAQQAIADKRYGDAVAALENVSRENMSAKYADVAEMYDAANYEYANELYADKKPYEALRYYNNILHYKDVQSDKLDRVCYRILGLWVSTTGVVMEFREDGTCVIDGQEWYFYARNFSLETGEQPDDLTGRWTIHSCNGKTMSLENTRTHKQYKLTKQVEE